MPDKREEIASGMRSRMMRTSNPSGDIISPGLRELGGAIRDWWKEEQAKAGESRAALKAFRYDRSPENMAKAEPAMIDIATMTHPLGAMGGMLKGVVPEVAKRIRSVMKAQHKLRQRPKATPGSEIRGETEEMIDQLGSSVAWRNYGRDEQGIVGNRLSPGKSSRFEGVTQVGEPSGVSTTFDSSVATNWEDGAAPANRVLNLFTARPSDVVIQAWKGSKHEPVMQEAFANALAKQPQGKLKKILRPGKAGGIDVRVLKAAMTLDNKEFNRLMSKDLQSKGFEGVTYGPGRFQEQEIKMLDSRRVIPLEKPRPATDPAISRHLTKKVPISAQEVIPQHADDIAAIYKMYPGKEQELNNTLVQFADSSLLPQVIDSLLHKRASLSHMFGDLGDVAPTKQVYRNPAIPQYLRELKDVEGNLDAMYTNIPADVLRKALRENALLRKGQKN